MIHASFYKPHITPKTVAEVEIDRAQAIDPTVTLNREKIEEIGRDGIVGYINMSPTVGYRLTQYEYGNIEFWQKLVDSDVLGADGQTEITLNDFKTPYFDISAYLTDDDGSFKGVIKYSALRTAGFSLTIGEPQGIIERGFDFVGEQADILQTASDTEFTLNNSDPAGLLGDCASIYLYIPGTGKPSSSDYIYRLQNVTIDVSFDREDIKELGNRDVVARGVRDKTVTITLGRILEDFTVEEILSGQSAGTDIDVENLSDQITLIVKIFSDNTKDSGTFTYGFKATGLTPTELRGGAGVNEYVRKDTSLEGEALIISADITKLGI